MQSSISSDFSHSPHHKQQSGMETGVLIANTALFKGKLNQKENNFFFLSVVLLLEDGILNAYYFSPGSQTSHLSPSVFHESAESLKNEKRVWSVNSPLKYPERAKPQELPLDQPRRVRISAFRSRGTAKNSKARSPNQNKPLCWIAGAQTTSLKPFVFF